MVWKGKSLYKKKKKMNRIISDKVLLTDWSGVVLGAIIVNGGTGYVNSTGLSTVGGSGTHTGFLNCKVDIITDGGVVTNITINSGGLGYTLNDTLIVIGGNNNCTFKANPVS